MSLMHLTFLLSFLLIARLNAVPTLLNPPLYVLKSDEHKVVFEFNPGKINLPPDRSSVSIPGTARLAFPGEPDLPGLRVLIGCPQSGSVELKCTVEQLQEFDNVQIKPAPALSEQPVLTAATFQQNRFFPETWAEIEEFDKIRNLRVARVRLNPVQFNPAAKKLRIARIRVTIEFSEPGKLVLYPDPLDSILVQTLVNGATAVHWKFPKPGSDTINFFSRFNTWCRVQTETTGIYQITFNDLNNTGFDPKLIDPRTFRLFTIGPHILNGPYPDTMIELPIYVSGAEDGSFDSKDFILFYAQSPSWWNDSLTRWEENYYTRYQTFWLTWGKGEGKRMATQETNASVPRNRALNKARIEQDLLCPARGGLLWVWERYNGANQLFNRPFTLINRDTLKRLTVRFYAKSDGPSAIYPVVLRLNGVILDTVQVRAQNQACPPNTFLFESLPLSAAVRTLNADTLTIEPLDAGDIYLDFIEVDYTTRLELSAEHPEISFYTIGPAEFIITGVDQKTTVLNVTNPLSPIRLTGITGSQLQFQVTAGLNRFFCAKSSNFRKPLVTAARPGELRTTTETADYYIICPDEFLAAARLFAQYRDGNIYGLENGRARAVALSSIYDDYAFGIQEPGAIKAFLSAKQPAYGLLLGDATYDYKNNLNLNPPPGVPAYEIGFDLDYEVYNPVVRALDAWFADFDGTGSGPDMILARITARSPSEVRNSLDKIRSYESQELDLWARRFLLMGDDEYLGDVSRPESFVHIYGCEGIAPLVSNLLDVEKIYLTEYRLEAVNSKPRANAELLRQLNSGALMWCFFGHGSGFQLCHERAFHIDDVPRVHNGRRLPVAFFGSCGVGRFDDTRYESIAEELVRSPEGCIATLGASKATYSGGNENFAHIFFSQLLSRPELPLGNAFYPAWLNYNLYILFGDPATKIRLPSANLPLTVTPDTMRPGASINFSARIGWPGNFALRATEAARERFYRSDVGTVNYILPGQEIFRLTGHLNDSITGSFVLPRLDFPDTVIVDNGWYARLRNSCQLTGLVWNQNQLQNLISPALYLSPETVGTSDLEPPSVMLTADNVTLNRGDTVTAPKRFRLTGRLSDPSGILLVPNLPYSLSFYIDEKTRTVQLSDYFRYDDNRGTSGIFTYPVELENELDSLILISADNCLNSQRSVYYLKTSRREELRIDSCLIYPNPVSHRAFFTFILSRPATVKIKIYTIAGRLVRELGPQECHFGYNQIEWDCCDRNGNLLANGVYLYKIDARRGEISGSSVRTHSISYRDKLIVRN